MQMRRQARGAVHRGDIAGACIILRILEKIIQSAMRGFLARRPVEVLGPVRLVRQQLPVFQTFTVSFRKMLQMWRRMRFAHLETSYRLPEWREDLKGLA